MEVRGASFFWDGETFEALKQHVFPDVVRRKRGGGTIRLWCADCSSGEPAYSILIALVEYLSENDASDLPIQLFGTDLTTSAIEQARAGLYTDAAMGNVSAERRERFFTEEAGLGYRISKSVRERCAFGRHDLVADPPFPRIDLLSWPCDVMSFAPELRARALRTLQFSLNAPGFLLLDRPANIADLRDVLTPIDDGNTIFARKEIITARPSPLARSHDDHDPRSSNEDLIASNQELQLANEELEAAKEELEAANQELIAVDEERVQLLRAMEAAKASAEEANRAKDIFLATLSHELRTPLSSLLLASNLLRTGQLGAHKLGQVAEIIAGATRQQAQLIDDLLDVSRIATGKLMMELRAVSVATVVQAAVDALAPAAESKQLQMRVELDRALPPVSGDPIRLQQVVANLLTNAIKFTPEHGQVAVVVDAAEGRGRIRVTDTGAGIAPAFLPQLFDRFSQEDRGQSRAQAGLGLGLPIARYIVEAHGGTIHAASPGKGAGATFTVWLPLMTAREGPVGDGEARPRARRIGGQLKGVRILLVEDDPATREALSMMLSLLGAAVRSAESVATAIAAFGGYRPDLLISDIALADGDGHTLLGRIRSLGPHRGADVPALALTALAGTEDHRRAIAAGFKAHVAKPVDIDGLLAAIRPLLDAS